MYSVVEEDMWSLTDRLARAVSDVTIGTVAGGTKTPAQIQLTAAAADTEVWWFAIGRATT